MSRYIVNVTEKDGTDSVTIADFAYEVADFSLAVKDPRKIRRIEDAQTRQEWTGSGIAQFIAMHSRPPTF
jgi:hypothetical protein